ncbi:ABC transporter ATP-binding protein [Clostridium sp. JN-1]|uniref:ABC transporter ATP-binding protein n=1 Tax=Clostridium sp. JN-1 TaxID=2483110 RepID=UPI000F0BA17F|nr:ABC transporter ATP-binding protein [Clostridium sp. JN-1]
MIELININKSYNRKTKAVDNLNLMVPDGEIFGFLGPNGAGKTTTIKMITGIIKADSGHININGVNIEKDPIKAKKNFGFVPDNPDMFLKLKGIEYLNFIADLYDVDTHKRIDIIKKLSQEFEMNKALDDKIQSYSHGMRQKIVIMGALVHNPSVWILDEPMTGLDPKSSYILKEMMRKHADKGNSVFFSTHILDIAEKLCDRFAIINKGKILFCGTFDELENKFENKESLEKIFLEMTENE